MSTFLLDDQLALLESQCRQAQASLLSGDETALQSAGQTLQRLTIELSHMAAQAGLVAMNHPHRVHRIKALAAAITMLREGLLRQLAYVERGLEIVVPATRDKSTYATGGAAAGVYGSPIRQSGAMSFLSA